MLREVGMIAIASGGGGIGWDRGTVLAAYTHLADDNGFVSSVDE